MPENVPLHPAQTEPYCPLLDQLVLHIQLPVMLPLVAVPLAENTKRLPAGSVSTTITFMSDEFSNVSTSTACGSYVPAEVNEPCFVMLSATRHAVRSRAASVITPVWVERSHEGPYALFTTASETKVVWKRLCVFPFRVSSRLQLPAMDWGGVLPAVRELLPQAIARASSSATAGVAHLEQKFQTARSPERRYYPAFRNNAPSGGRVSFSE